MLKLVSDKGKWATKDNSMIFSNIVWLCNREDTMLYHLIDEDKNEIKLDKDISEYIVNYPQTKDL